MRLFAGAGCETIHFPQELFPLEGFLGIHDDPVVRVLLLDCKERVALVSLELVMLPPELVDTVQDIVADHTGTGRKNVWVHTTHAITTPHAPHAPVGVGGVPLELSEEDQRNLETRQALFIHAVMTAVAEAAAEACAAFRPAIMGAGQGESFISVNRDVETPFGWWIGQNPQGKTDPVVTMLRFEDEDGKCIALLINSGLKPCAIDNSQMEAGTRLVSSDVPGLACRLMEEALGAPCLFFMGAAGDQVPVEQALRDTVQADGTVRTVDLGVEAGLAMVDRLGHRMAEELLPSARRIVCETDAPEIRLDSTCITWGGKGRIPMMPRKTVDYVPERDVRIDGNVLVIGNIALVGLKPEVNAITAEQLRRSSPYEKTLLISMVNGGQKYMPDAESYERITWEAQSSMMMPGAAEAWVQAVCETLTQMHDTV